MSLLKISMSLHTRLAAETRLVDGELLQVTEKWEEFLKLRERTRIPVIPERDGKCLQPE
jgi:hypothetical protein